MYIMDCLTALWLDVLLAAAGQDWDAYDCFQSIRVAKRLALPSSEHVVSGLKSHWIKYDWNAVEWEERPKLPSIQIGLSRLSGLIRVNLFLVHPSPPKFEPSSPNSQLATRNSRLATRTLPCPLNFGHEMFASAPIYVVDVDKSDICKKKKIREPLKR